MKPLLLRFCNANTPAPPYGRGLWLGLLWLLLLVVGIGPAFGQVAGPTITPPIAKMRVERALDSFGLPLAVTGVTTRQGEYCPDDVFSNEIGGVQIGQTCYVNYLGRNYIGESVLVKVYDEFTNVCDSPLNVTFTPFQSVEVHDPHGQLVSITVSSQGTGNNPTNLQNYNFTDFTFVPTLKGEYTIDAFINGYDATGSFVVEHHIRGMLSNIPRMEHVVVETPSICYNDFDKDYHFKVKTIPVQSDYMYYAADHTTGNTAPCGREETIELNAEVTSTVSIQEGSYAGGQLVSHLKSSLWQTPPSQSVIEDRYITSTDLQSLPSGSPITLTVHVTDGYLYDTTFTVDIPVIWPQGPSLTYDLTNYTVTGNEVWTPGNLPASIPSNGTNTIRIQDGLHVPAGTTLRMENMRIEFGPKGRMFIESDPSGDGSPKAGYVKLINSTLTSVNNCDEGGNKWLGIQLQGDFKKSQSPFMQYPDWQGTLVMENSEISNASYAVDAWDGTWAKTGGRIEATNSRFLNNRKSVSLYPYRNFNPNNQAVEWPYQARFSNCDFTVDEALPNGYIGFITANSIRGFRVSGCRFVNNAPANPTVQNGFGIVGNCGVVIDGIYTNPSSTITGPPNIPTEFRNLKEAVHISELGNINAYATVLNSQFYNCNVGVQSDGALGAVTVRNNIFDLMEGVGFTPDKKKGVFINTGTGFLINNNTFDNSLNSRKSPGTTGVLVWNSGSTDNVVNNNIYKAIYAGNLGNYINRGAVGNPSGTFGLRFLCNDHSVNPYDMAARGNDVRTNGIHPLQQSGFEMAAGNVLSYERSWEVANYPGEVLPLTYYYGSGLNEVPLHYPASTVTIALTGNTTCADAGPTYGPGRVDPQPPPPPITVNNITPAEHSEAIAYYVADTAGMANRDSLYLWLQVPGSNAYHTLMRTDMLLEDSNLSASVAVYDSIVTAHGLQGQEAVEFTVWGRKLLNLRVELQKANRNLWQVSGSELDTLTLVADSATMWAKVRAQSWLTMLNPALTFENEILYPYCIDDTCDDSMASNKPAAGGNALPSVAQVAEKALSIAPNPTTGVVRVTIGTLAEMSVTDLTGRVVLTVSLKEGSQELNLSNLPNGLYLYRIQTTTGAVFAGKLTKQ